MYGKIKTVGYCDDVLWAYNENKTTKIRFQGLITKNSRCVVACSLEIPLSEIYLCIHVHLSCLHFACALRLV